MRDNASRPHSCQILVVKQADEMGIEINFVDAIRDLFQSHQFADKGSSDKTLSPSPFDVSTVAHSPCVPCAWIVHFGQLLRHGLIAGPINPPGHALAQGFVRTLVVVALDPCVSSAFLRPEGACRWAGCIGFENAMHLFVCGVVLRMRPSDKLHCNTQTQPPHAQARET